MKYLESIVGNKMKASQHYIKKALKAIQIVALLFIVSIAVTGLGLAQETASTLTPVQPVQTETELSAQENTNAEEDITTLDSQGSAVITTTVVTTPIAEDNNPESFVCDALANQIINNLAEYPHWQISLNDDNGNVQGLGEMGPGGLELQLFNPNARELYLYYFTDEKAITIANSSGLRISLFERDSATYAGGTSGGDSRGIIINATIGENREAQPINQCILPFEDVFPNYTIK